MFEQSDEEDTAGTGIIPAKPALTPKVEQLTEDVLMSMRGILATHEPDKCAGCFQRLAAAFDSMDSYPGNAEEYLHQWAEKTRLLKHQNGCDHCHPPVFGETGINSGMILPKPKDRLE